MIVAVTYGSIRLAFAWQLYCRTVIRRATTRRGCFCRCQRSSLACQSLQSPRRSLYHILTLSLCLPPSAPPPPTENSNQSSSAPHMHIYANKNRHPRRLARVHARRMINFVLKCRYGHGSRIWTTQLPPNTSALFIWMVAACYTLSRGSLAVPHG